MRIFIYNVLLAAVVVGCAPVSYSHFQSETNLEQGLERRIRAEKLALDQKLVKPPYKLTGELKSPDLTSLSSTRVALAEDARSDYEIATGSLQNATDADRVSALLRASRKLWYAGIAADPSLVSSVKTKGESTCGAISSFKPERDCELLRVMPYLTLMQGKRDIMLDVEIERLAFVSPGNANPSVSDIQAAMLAKAIVEMDKESNRLNTYFATARPDIRRFVEIQQVTYWCWATDALVSLQSGTTRGKNEVRGQVYDLLLGQSGGSLSQQLTNAFATSGLDPSAASGVYPEYSKRVFSLVGKANNDAAKPHQNKRACKKIRKL